MRYENKKILLGTVAGAIALALLIFLAIDCFAGPLTPPVPGPQGIQGIQGIQGVAGTNGTNGTNGTTAPTVACNAGSPSAVTGTDSDGFFTVGTAAVNCTLTFNLAWNTSYGCLVNASTTTGIPTYASATPLTTAVFTFVTTGTPILYYHCSGK